LGRHPRNPGTGALIRHYGWIGDTPVAVIEGGQIYYVRTDQIGRPVFATTSAGTVVWSAAYLPFGGVRVTTGAPIDLRFPGQWFQTEAGLHQNWMRDYDPTTGRYMQADPLGLVDGAQRPAPLAKPLTAKITH
jgi:RHS repeat-associated protein